MSCQLLERSTNIRPSVSPKLPFAHERGMEMEWLPCCLCELRSNTCTQSTTSICCISRSAGKSLRREDLADVHDWPRQRVHHTAPTGDPSRCGSTIEERSTKMVQARTGSDCCAALSGVILVLLFLECGGSDLFDVNNAKGRCGNVLCALFT
jgi:hypothetical protein